MKVLYGMEEGSVKSRSREGKEVLVKIRLENELC